MRSELVISGNFFVDSRFVQLEIGVSKGVIDAVGRNVSGERHMRMSGPILPAGTDIHVHFRDPGETEKEDFRSGTISALFGGTTSIFDMPNNKVLIDNISSFQEKLSVVSPKAYCDFGLYSLFNGSNIADIDQRSSGIKIFLGGSTNSTGLSRISDADAKSMNDLNLPVVFHAENQECLNGYRIAYPETLRDHNRARPEECENIAIESVNGFKIDRKIGAHLSSPRSLELAGTGVIREVTPHHMLLNDEMELGSWGKVNPPLRSKNVMNELFQLYRNGKFDIISSDHAPHTEYEKQEFSHAASGIIGVETRIPLLLGLLSKRLLDINTLVQTAIVRPAEVMSIRKGKIAVGYFADLMNFDLGDLGRVNESKLHSKTKISPFNGFDAIFPRNVMMRGELVIEDHELIEDHLGRFVNDLKAVNS